LLSPKEMGLREARWMSFLRLGTIWVFHKGGDPYCGFLGCDTAWSGAWRKGAVRKIACRLTSKQFKNIFMHRSRVVSLYWNTDGAINCQSLDLDTIECFHTHEYWYRGFVCK
jgi:hypothetical protein